MDILQRLIDRNALDIYNEHVAIEMKTYDKKMQAVVQHYMNNIIFQADMGSQLSVQHQRILGIYSAPPSLNITTTSRKSHNTIPCYILPVQLLQAILHQLWDCTLSRDVIVLLDIYCRKFLLRIPSMNDDDLIIMAERFFLSRFVPLIKVDYTELIGFANASQ